MFLKNLDSLLKPIVTCHLRHEELCLLHGHLFSMFHFTLPNDPTGETTFLGKHHELALLDI